MFTKRFQQFVQLETASGILLLVALILALIIANSGLYHYYDAFLDTPIQIRVATLNLEKPIIHWINDGLMAIFFMLLAMEIKREMLDGELSSFQQMILPFAAAIGGIVLPAAIYFALNHHDAKALAGWPIATTTDIAFALALIALLGKRVPNSLKVFLVALSIVDDILAIAIIAVFYTNKLSYLSLVLALIGITLLLLFNLFNIKRTAPYMIVGIIIWICVLKSGVHATLAGVLVGFTIPLSTRNSSFSPLRHLENKLHPWVAYLILPLFVFANGGINFSGVELGNLLHPVSIAIILGLVVGKTLGVFLASWILVQLRFARLPEDSNWMQLFGIAAASGIGFTMSLFLGSLAFFNTPYESMARKSIVLGSFISAAIAIAAFNITYRRLNSTAVIKNQL